MKMQVLEQAEAEFKTAQTIQDKEGEAVLTAQKKLDSLLAGSCE
jgi:hypothetical protein